MAHEFNLSEIGLKLIKAYEGFRPIETTLVSGQRVIGYGHKYLPDEEQVISRQKAETIFARQGNVTIWLWLRQGRAAAGYRSPELFAENIASNFLSYKDASEFILGLAYLVET